MKVARMSMSQLVHVRQRPARARPRKAAVAVVEFALIAPVLIMLAIGLADYGFAIWTKLQVKSAARAGAAYAVLYGWNNGLNTAKIQSAVTGATALSVAASPAPTASCGCLDATTGLTAATCGALCSGNSDTAGTYVTVSAQATFRSLLSYPGFVFPAAITATEITRTQ
jgi:Flp pilus assembly protein TadG